MLLWVRSGVQINLSFGFSRAVGSASDTSNDKVLYQPNHPIVRQCDFRVKMCFKQKTIFPSEFLHVTVRYPRPGWRILTPFPSRNEAKPACAEHTCSVGSTNPCPTDVPMKPFPSAVFTALI